MSIIRITSQVGVYKKAAFLKAADRELEILFHEAARAFYIASVRRIPIRSGFLRGAFDNLKDVVGRNAPTSLTGQARVRSLKRLITSSQIPRRIRVARTNRGRIVGANAYNKFNLGEGERVKKVFTLLEYYYPVPRSRADRVVKNPRTGRRFATPSTKIITKSNFKGAVKYYFNFSVDIRYLPVNDVRLAWQSWEAGMRAFNQHIFANAQKRMPDLTEFIQTETIGTGKPRLASLKRG